LTDVATNSDTFLTSPAQLRFRRIDVLELLRIVEALKADPRRVFADILKLKSRS
jgi:hypothetical protein